MRSWKARRRSFVSMPADPRKVHISSFARSPSSPAASRIPAMRRICTSSASLTTLATIGSSSARRRQARRWTRAPRSRHAMRAVLTQAKRKKKKAGMPKQLTFEHEVPQVW